MKITDLVRLITRVLSMCLIVLTACIIIPYEISIVVTGVYWIDVWRLLMIPILLGLVFWLMVIKTDWLIRLLKLDKGYDDDYITNHENNPRQWYDLAIIVIGCEILIRFFPEFIKLAITYGSDTSLTILDDVEHILKDNRIDMIISLIASIVGFLLLVFHYKISLYLVSKDDKNKKNAA